MAKIISRHSMYPDLTVAQGNILHYILEHHSVHNMAPTMREIGAKFAIRSPNGVQCHLEALKTKGYLEKHSSKARSLIPTEKAKVTGVRFNKSSKRVYLDSPPARMKPEQAILIGSALLAAAKRVIGTEDFEAIVESVRFDRGDILLVDQESVAASSPDARTSEQTSQPPASPAADPQPPALSPSGVLRSYQHPSCGPLSLGSEPLS